jgi:O-antigen/teichoic acid export membrane protein
VRSQLITLARQAATYGASGAAIQVVGLITLPVYARAFTAAEYGALEVATIGFSAALLFADAGLASAMQRQYFDYADEHRRERATVISTALVAMLVLAVAMAVPLVLLRGPIAAWTFDDRRYATLVALVGLAVPIAAIAAACREVMRLRFQAAHYAASSILGAALGGLGGVVAIATAHADVAGVFACVLGGQVLALGYGLAIVVPQLVPAVSRPELRRLLAFGLPLLPASLGMWGISFLDRVALAKLDTLSATGEYAVGTRFASVLMFLVSAFTAAYTPFLYSRHAADPVGERALRARLLTYLASGLCATALVLALFAREIVAVVAPGFDHAHEVVGILCLGVAAFGLSPVTVAGIGIAKRTGYVSRTIFIALAVNVACVLVLIPTLGLVGAALATASAYILITALYGNRSQKLDPVPFDTRRVVAVFLVTAAAMPLGVVHLHPEALAIAAKLGALVAYALVLWHIGVIGPAERVAIRQAMARRREAPPAVSA